MPCRWTFGTVMAVQFEHLFHHKAKSHAGEDEDGYSRSGDKTFIGEFERLGDEMHDRVTEHGAGSETDEHEDDASHVGRLDWDCQKTCKRATRRESVRVVQAGQIRKNR